MIRLGLCCVFLEASIRFKRTTAAFLMKHPEEFRRKRLSEICLNNAISLKAALKYCKTNRIGSFRINSQILPLKTHPDLAYRLEDLPDGQTIISAFDECRAFAVQNDLRMTFHPDQFILLSSPNPQITRRSVADLLYQASLARRIGADVVNIHGGGAYGNKPDALKRLRREIDRLPDLIRSLLTLENDDRIYTPEELLPVCRDLDIPLVYDVHHHRCLPDMFSVEQATEKALATWNREPLFHLSSPLSRETPALLRKHHDYIDPSDVPGCWIPLDITVEVEAKAKEKAVEKLYRDLYPDMQPHCIIKPEE